MAGYECYEGDDGGLYWGKVSRPNDCGAMFIGGGVMFIGERCETADIVLRTCDLPSGHDGMHEAYAPDGGLFAWGADGATFEGVAAAREP